MKHKQYGFSIFPFIIFLLGIVVGVVASAVVAFYVTKAPIPLVDKYIQPGELHARSNWNPNKMLQQADSTQAASSGQSSDGNNTQYPQGEEPVPVATLGVHGRERVEPSTANAPEVRTDNTNAAQQQYFVQAGAFSSSADAEQQRARLVLLLGTQATVSQVTAAGKTVHRVRLGPYATREAASMAQKTLASNGIDAAIVSLSAP